MLMLLHILIPFLAGYAPFVWSLLSTIRAVNFIYFLSQQRIRVPQGPDDAGALYFAFAFTAPASDRGFGMAWASAMLLLGGKTLEYRIKNCNLYLYIYMLLLK